MASSTRKHAEVHDWRVSNTDEDYDQWLKCYKCHQNLHIPLALTCLHTVCEKCLLDHYRWLRTRIETINREDPGQYIYVDHDKCCTCPVCYYPFYFIQAVNELPVNFRMLRLTYKERLLWRENRGLPTDPRPESQENRPSKMNQQLSLTPVEASAGSSEGGPAPRSPSAAGASTEVSAERMDRSPRAEKDSGDAGAEDGYEGVHSDEGGDESKAEEVAGLAVESQEERAENLGAQKRSSEASDDEKAKEIDKMVKSLAEHFLHVRKQCLPSPVNVMENEDASLPGSIDAELLEDYGLVFGTEENQVLHPVGIAINPHGGQLAVIDSSLNKALFFKKPRAIVKEIKLKHPPSACCYVPPNSHTAKEAFFTVGRRRTGPGLMLCKIVIANNYEDHGEIPLKMLRDISGLMFHNESKQFIMSFPDYNTVGREVLPNKFDKVAGAQSHRLCYPTHIIEGKFGEIIFSDTGNHRLWVFHGPQQLVGEHKGRYGAGNGEFFYPLGLAMDSERRLFVCDSNNYRVQVLDRSYCFESCPIKRTFNLAPKVTQDVKPMDCVVDSKDRLIVLFRGRSFVALRMYKYHQPLIVYEEEYSPNIVQPHISCCWRCLTCCCKKHRYSNLLDNISRDRSQYEPIQ